MNLAFHSGFAALSFLTLSSVADPALGATRVFHDGFEADLSSVWQADGSRAKCTVVTVAADQSAPHSGSEMLECNWNGQVEWNDPEAYRALVLGSWKYEKEFFIRYWVRYDADVDHAFGNKLMRLGSQWYNELYLGAQMESAPTAPMFSYFESLGGEPGNNVPGPLSYGAGLAFGDGSWHQVEIHILQSSPSQNDGSVRIWLDDAIVNDADELVTVATGHDWYPLYVMSNWSSNGPEWAHDEANHTYWDDFEIFSDDETGDPATGSMAIGSIEAEGSEPDPVDAGTSVSDAGAQPKPDAGAPPVGDGSPAQEADAAANAARASNDDSGCTTSSPSPRPLPLPLVFVGALLWFARRRRSS
jgi:hypothetical protein